MDVPLAGAVALSLGDWLWAFKGAAACRSAVRALGFSAYHTGKIMTDRSGIFAGDDPFELARSWLSEATASELNDPNAIALSTVDADGLPNVRMVLLKEIEKDAFVFFTNYESRKAHEIEQAGKAAFVIHWKSLRRQIRVRGMVVREEGPQADAYYASRSLKSRLGAWASHQSQPLASRAELMAAVARVTAQQGVNPERPPFWGGYRLIPSEIEFWADGAFRLHDRFRWTRSRSDDPWETLRLFP
jgi:pyridoxamine 5'-phosphate oxidase